MYALGRGSGRLFRRGGAARTRSVKVAAAIAGQSSGKAAVAQLWLQRNDFASVLVMSLLPPPAPFKVFVVMAGVLGVNPLRFGLALLVGRGSRFVAEGLLGARYGAQAETYIEHHIGKVSLALAVTVTLGALAYRKLHKPKGDAGHQ
jgi:membrane protein YqaA with SNARE-associated domain